MYTSRVEKILKGFSKNLSVHNVAVKGKNNGLQKFDFQTSVSF